MNYCRGWGFNCKTCNRECIDSRGQKEDEKYYWMCWEHTTKFGKTKYDCAFKEHPFKEREKIRKRSGGYVVILNYKEITKEEYEMFDLELEDM